MSYILSNIWNGRVDAKSRISKQNEIKNPFLTSIKLNEPLLGLIDESNLSVAFFSKENTKIIQNALRKAIYDKSNKQYLIDEQDVRELHIVMRSIYLLYSRNLPYNIAEQVSELNNMVLNYCIQQVYTECKTRHKYLNDISTLVIPIEHPINTSNTDRELVLKEWF